MNLAQSKRLVAFLSVGILSANPLERRIWLFKGEGHTGSQAPWPCASRRDNNQSKGNGPRGAERLGAKSADDAGD